MTLLYSHISWDYVQKHLCGSGLVVSVSTSVPSPTTALGRPWQVFSVSFWFRWCREGKIKQTSSPKTSKAQFSAVFIFAWDKIAALYQFGKPYLAIIPIWQWELLQLAKIAVEATAHSVRWFTYLELVMFHSYVYHRVNAGFSWIFTGFSV